MSLKARRAAEKLYKSTNGYKRHIFGAAIVVMYIGGKYLLAYLKTKGINIDVPNDLSNGLDILVILGYGGGWVDALRKVLANKQKN